MRNHVTCLLVGNRGSLIFLPCLQFLVLCDKFGKDDVSEQAIVSKSAKDSIIKAPISNLFFICCSLVLTSEQVAGFPVAAHSHKTGLNCGHPLGGADGTSV